MVGDSDTGTCNSEVVSPGSFHKDTFALSLIDSSTATCWGMEVERDAPGDEVGGNRFRGRNNEVCGDQQVPTTFPGKEGSGGQTVSFLVAQRKRVPT